MTPVSAAISRLSALYLGGIGLTFLFGSDALLPVLIAGYPAEGAWLGQLLAAAWLAAAVLNWNGRNTVLGGVYGRPLVNLNLLLYFIGALGLAKSGAGGLVTWMLTAPMSLFALVYGVVLLRGPFDSLTAE
ncbi:MAG TPA: hypothetical protein VFM71_11585 [Gemmatimonadaceae bacterium]|nr:hypothetical protein [Gemmatimonadaceae bacterium]